MAALHPAIDVNAFATICEQSTALSDYPLASGIRKNVVCYDGDRLRMTIAGADDRIRLLQEIAQALETGPGLIIVKKGFNDHALLDRQNDIFNAILAEEAEHSTGDHFAQAGANGRIWNVLEKSALRDPDSFVEYYKNPLLTLISEAWLGPNFQVTAQVNVVRPGGQAQAPHRDYHLGFQTSDVLQHFPPHVHRMSAMLTLQGAVAHTDMPIESGSTLLLPFSQQYPQGYLAWRDQAFKDYFAEHAIQLPLEKGDFLFFNPALFHAAGSNITKDFHRIANLLQVSSAFGIPMEMLNRQRMANALYPALVKTWQALDDVELDAILSSSFDGYSFPTSLDTDPPLSGMAPETQRQLVQRGLDEGWGTEKFGIEQDALFNRRKGGVFHYDLQAVDRTSIADQA